MPIGHERGDRRGDLRPGQHPAGQLDRDLGLDRYAPAVSAHRAVRRADRGLRPEQVVHGLDDEQVDATLEESVGELLVRRAQVVERIWPSDGNFVPGPIDPATHRRRARRRDIGRRPPSRSVALASRARGRGPRCRTRRGRPRSRRRSSVSMTSTPTSRNERWSSLDDVGPGRARGPRCTPRGRRPPKSSAVELRELEVRPGRAVEDDGCRARAPRGTGDSSARMRSGSCGRERPLRHQATGAPADSISPMRIYTRDW